MCVVLTPGEILEMSGRHHSYLEYLKELGIEPDPEQKEEES